MKPFDIDMPGSRGHVERCKAGIFTVGVITVYSQGIGLYDNNATADIGL